MRTRTIVLGALLLASAGIAQAQDTQQQTTGQVAPQMATPASSFIPKFGKIDFGYRGDDITGDEARYNRFRDLRDGAYVSRFQVAKETDAFLFRAEAFNIGYRDQRYAGEFQSIGRVKAAFEWNQIPLFLTKDTRSLYRDNGSGVLAIDDAIQQSIQSAVALGTAARDAAIANALAIAPQTDLRSRRDVGTFDMAYTLNRDVDLKFKVRNTNRSGNQVMSFGFGTSPGLNPAVELGAPIDDRTTDIKGALEFANSKAMLSVGYDGSWYDNQFPLVRFDNPLRASDISAGPSVGQFAWWPGNSAFSVNMNGSYKFAKRTRASAGISVGRWEQDETLPAPTVNSALVSPTLERGSADTRADITSMVFGLNSRPITDLRLSAKYRYYDYNNKTPHFHVENAIIGDWAAGTQIHDTEPSSFKRKTLDLDASYAPLDYLSLGVGYGREDADRSFRIFEKTADDTFRFTVDSLASNYFSVRLKYEYSERTGSGFEEHLLDEVGEQPEMRHFDIANRDRSRTTAIFTVTPVSILNLNASIGRGKDDYTDSGFGLRDNENNTWSAGFDLMPNEKVSFGVSYGEEKYTAFQYSRTANPLSATDVTFLDPRRDWWMDQDDKVNTFSASLDLTKALPKTDIRLSYDLSDGEATYLYGMRPDQTVFTTTPLRQLPELDNRLATGRFDVQHFVRPNVALGVVYHYEDYEVQDFALGPETIDRLDARNGTTGLFASTIYAGFLFKPYTAHTWALRMTYLW
jgi:MtrB/PioB family decaheme-associated outer membrane protein